MTVIRSSPELTLQCQSLLVLEGRDASKGLVDIIKIEGSKVCNCMPCHVLIVHEYLPHFLHWECGIDWHRQLEPTNLCSSRTSVFLCI